MNSPDIPLNFWHAFGHPHFFNANYATGWLAARRTSGRKNPDPASSSEQMMMLDLGFHAEAFLRPSNLQYSCLNMDIHHWRYKHVKPINYLLEI